jgi:hypothetical protein
MMLCGCQGTLMEPGGNAGPTAEDQPCTDPLTCCPDDKKQCYGDPDKGMICQCTDLWDCSKDPEKCEQPMQVPGTGDWTCTWTDTGYTCTKQGDKDEAVGGGDWSCSWSQGTWTCTKTPPNPTNQPGGLSTWECTVDNENDTLHCRKKTPTTPPPASPDGGAGPPPAPPTADMSSWPWPFPPSQHDAGPAPDSGNTGPPPPLPPGVKSGSKCVPGTTIWCDGSTYCGWGQMTCPPNGTWPSLAACKELPDGRRPNTPCACYHFYYNPMCCETPDCVVPAGSNGQICPESAGKLCDYCNPLKPECESGAKCIITTSNESFCGQPCSASNPCPSGYTCKGSNKGSQCYPSDGSCYK